MSWARIDDAMPESLKVAPLSDAAFRAYVTSICYCARNLTDGFIPNKVALHAAGKPRVVQELVPGLWEVTTGGYRVHDYLDYNPTREVVLAERQKARDRMNIARSSRNVRANIARSSPNPVPDPVPLPQKPEEVVEEDVPPVPRRNIFVLYDQFMGKPAVTAAIRPFLIQAEEDYPEDCIRHCFEEAAKSSDGRRSWKYVEAILKRHESEGCVERGAMGRNAKATAQTGDAAAAALGVYGPPAEFDPDYWTRRRGADEGSPALAGDEDHAGVEAR